MLRVTQLVHQHVGNQLWRQKQKPCVETDQTARRTTAPSGLLLPDRYGRVTEFTFVTYSFEPRDQMFFSLMGLTILLRLSGRRRRHRLRRALRELWPKFSHNHRLHVVPACKHPPCQVKRKHGYGPPGVWGGSGTGIHTMLRRLYALYGFVTGVEVASAMAILTAGG